MGGAYESTLSFGEDSVGTGTAVFAPFSGHRIRVAVNRGSPTALPYGRRAAPRTASAFGQGVVVWGVGGCQN